MKNNKFIVYSEWWRKPEGMFVRRSALPLSHPESIVQLWIKEYGDAEDFPWKSVYGEYPTLRQLIEAGIRKCPICGESEET